MDVITYPSPKTECLQYSLVKREQAKWINISFWEMIMKISTGIYHSLLKIISHLVKNV